MKPSAAFRIQAAKRRAGVALVVILAFIVLLLAVLMAYFSQSLLSRQVSKSSTSYSIVQHLADGAVNTVIGDLRSEIKAGSSATNIVTGSTTNTIYFPSAATNAVPALAGSGGTNGLENLVKRSASGVAFYPGGSSRAANSPTTVPSANGRYISAARWNRPLFIQPSSTNDLSPVASAGFVAPDWIYVARDGSNQTNWDAGMRWSETSPSAVVGRFAYAIYDEGGVLDANVAGYPQGNAVVESASAFKNALAYADLKQAGLSTNNIGTLVGWRNMATLSGQDTNFIGYVARNTNGFLRAANTSLYNGQSDRLFSSRLQLIDFFNTQLGGDTDADVKGSLRYFTHFSRGLEQPDYAPSANRPLVRPAANGGNNAATLDGEINVSFLTKRTSAGEPLVKKRFALNRLAWLTCKGPSAARTDSSAPDIAALVSSGIPSDYLAAGTLANIGKYFGLAWDATNHRWEYNVHNGGSGVIKKLADISGREPDFFELLKAAVGAGSLAKTLTAPSVSSPLVLAGQYNLDSSLDYAIVQLGANIIDQADTDGYPTQIVFNDGTISRTFVGVENLPYIYRVRNGLIKVAMATLAPAAQVKSSTSAAGSVKTLGTSTIADTGVGALVQYVDLWNPHDYSATNLNQTLGANPAAQQFRVFATTPSTVVVSAFPSGGGNYAWNGSYASQFTSSPTDQSASPGFNSVYGFSWAGESRSMTESNTQLTFQIPRSTTGAALFREPTILFQPGKPTGSNLQSPAFSTPQTGLIGQIAATAAFFANGGLKSDVGLGAPDNNRTDSSDTTGIPTYNTGYLGFYIGSHPLIWARGTDYVMAQQTAIGGDLSVTYELQCQDAYGDWVTYDNKSASWNKGGVNSMVLEFPESQFLLNYKSGPNFAVSVDPRSSRFGLMTGWPTAQSYYIPPFKLDIVSNLAATGFINKSEGIVLSDRDGYCGGVLAPAPGGNGWVPTTAMGWYPGGWDGAAPKVGNEPLFRIGMLSQNDPALQPRRSFSDQITSAESGYPSRDQTGGSNVFYADPDGVVRRAMGAFVTIADYATNAPNQSAALGGSPAWGLPMATANDNGTTRTSQSSSRPVVLNRPFRSVGELGYVFSGTPWKNIDFFLPESGDAALLDVFCVGETGDPSGLVAGRISLNTRQPVCLQAILSGAYKDEFGSSGVITDTLARQVSAALATRTATNPLGNVSELVGKWVGTTNVTGATPAVVSGKDSYDGFTKDLSAILPGGQDQMIQRFRESSIRALGAAGQTRVWNLMIDLAAQAGRFPPSATGWNGFQVEAETRYWAHVAIDRLTGQLLDIQIEVVKE